MRLHITPNLEDRKRYTCNKWGSSYTERYNYMVWLRFFYIRHFIVFQQKCWFEYSIHNLLVKIINFNAKFDELE